MTIKELCEKIELPEEVISQIINFNDNFKYGDIEKISNKLFEPKVFAKASQELKNALAPDDNGIKTLSVMLKCCLITKEKYDKIGISEEIFIDTMKCFTRFVNEHYESFGYYGFDRHWWTVRQLAMTLFRIGELEYEMYNYEGENVLSIHIPSDCVLNQEKLRQSYLLARGFFAKYFLKYKDVKMFCCSWLLSPDLKQLLNSNSNIIKFADNFSILKTELDKEDFINWVFKKQNFNIKDKESVLKLQEDTSLQKNIKKFLLDGNDFHLGTGLLKGDPFC